MSNPLVEIMKLGQSIWYDNIRRAMLVSGDLQKKIDEDDQLGALVKAGKSVPEIYEDLVVDDIGRAADILKPVYDQTDGIDGYISLEVNPRLAYDTKGTIEEADRLFHTLGRKN